MSAAGTRNVALGYNAFVAEGVTVVHTPHGAFYSHDHGRTWEAGGTPNRRLAWRIGSALMAWAVSTNCAGAYPAQTRATGRAVGAGRPT